MSDEEIIAMFQAAMQEAKAQGRFFQTTAGYLEQDEHLEAIAEQMAAKTNQDPDHILKVIKGAREIVLPHVEEGSSIIRMGFPQIITPPWFKRD